MAKIKNNTTIAVLIISLAIVGAIYLLNQNYQPEFFDKFGLLCFSFITGLSVWMLKTKKETSDLLAFILLGIGIAGLIVDGAIVFGG